MTDDFLVGYLMHALDPDEEARVEEALSQNPELRQRLDAFAGSVSNLLEADSEMPPPPPGLKYRTLARVAELRLEEQRNHTPIPFTLRPSREVAVTRSWWRRADVLVAASLLVIVLPLLGSGVAYARYRYNIVMCQNNLRGFHDALTMYANINEGRYPRVEPVPPRDLAGVVMPLLQQNGLTSGLKLRCAANTSEPTVACSLQDLEKAHEKGGPAFDALANNLIGDYAYTLGYYDADGNLHGPTLHREPGDMDLMPIMADRPSFSQVKEMVSATPNSLNHAGKGQNVLFLGGNVRFVSSPRLGEDDIYLNQDHHIAAGRHREDSVLGGSNFRPNP